MSTLGYMLTNFFKIEDIEINKIINLQERLHILVLSPMDLYWMREG